MAGWAERLYDRIRGAFRDRGRGLLFLEPFKRQVGVPPRIRFEDLLHIYEGHPAVASAVNFIAWQAVGGGFYTTMNDGYDERRGGLTAKEYVDQWNERVGLDEMLQITAIYLVAFGNAFWHKQGNDIDQVQLIPIQSVERLIPEKTSGEAVTPWTPIRALRLTSAYGGATIPWEDIIHFRLCPLRGDGFGTGLVHKLVQRMRVGDGETRYGYAEIIGRIENAIMRQFEKFGMPNELWIFPGVRDDLLREYHARIQELPMSGARFTTNIEGARVEQIVPQRSRGFNEYLKALYDVFYLALETPLPKLFTTPGFTEASARAAVEVAERKVMALQRLIKRVVERQVWWEVLRRAGFDPARAEVRLHWGIPRKPKFETRDVLEAYRLGVIDRVEARKILAELGWPVQSGGGEGESPAETKGGR